MRVGHERLRNKSSGSGEGRCPEGIGKPVLEAGVPSIDLDEAQVRGYFGRFRSPIP